MLVLAPKYFRRNVSPSEFSSQLSVWVLLADTILQLMQTAVRIWAEISQFLNGLLDMSDSKDFGEEDKTFSELKNVLWFIGKVDEILPIVHDSVDQWNWFRAGNSRLSLPINDICYEEPQHYNDSIEELKLRISYRLKLNTKELETARHSLENYELEFAEMKTRAALLKDRVSWNLELLEGTSY